MSVGESPIRSKAVHLSERYFMSSSTLRMLISTGLPQRTAVVLSVSYRILTGENNRSRWPCTLLSWIANDPATL